MIKRVGTILLTAGTGIFLLLVPMSSTAQNIKSLADVGKELFNDPSLSVDGRIACASCHRSDHAFADITSVSLGSGHQHGTRNAPSLLNLEFYSSLFWDGRAATLENQAQIPFKTEVEFGHGAETLAIDRVRRNAAYQRAFRDALGIAPAEITLDTIAQALVAYERSLGGTDSEFDHCRDGQCSPLNKMARRGYELFQGSAGCSACHSVNDNPATFTDNRYHSAGSGMEHLAINLSETARRLNALPLAKRLALIPEDPMVAELGRYVVTLEPSDIGTFRTPSLRNVALTAPYMHDGSVATLEEAVEREVYYQGIQARGRPTVLSADDKAALVSFLRTLTSQRFSRSDPKGAASVNPPKASSATSN